jgi:hypothetical protein
MSDDPDFSRRGEVEKLKKLAADTTQDEIKRWIDDQRPKTLSEMVIRDVVARHEDGSAGYKQWVGGRDGFLESEPLWGRARQMSERQSVSFEAAYTHLANKVFEILDEPRITTEQAIEEIAQQKTSSLMHRITSRPQAGCAAGKDGPVRRSRIPLQGPARRPDRRTRRRDGVLPQGIPASRRRAGHGWSYDQLDDGRRLQSKDR